MGYETTPFGDGVSTTRVQTVHNHFGQRDSEEVNGKHNTLGAFEELVIEVTSETLTAAAFPLIAPKLPAGAVPLRVVAEVVEAFDLGGTNPTILIGTETSEVTNGFVLDDSEAEVIGVYDLTSTLTGTWASPLAAATTVGIAQGGTDVLTNGTVGKVKFVIEYAVVKGARI